MNKVSIKAIANDVTLVSPEPVSREAKAIDLSVLGINVKKHKPATINEFGEIVR